MLPSSVFLFTSYFLHKANSKGAKVKGGMGAQECSIPNPPILVMTKEPNSNFFNPIAFTLYPIELK